MDSEIQKLKKKEYNDRYYAKRGQSQSKQIAYNKKINAICLNPDMLKDIIKNVGHDVMTNMLKETF